jgi:hypothetical protein
MGAKWSDKIQIDTTHFVCTTAASGPIDSPNTVEEPGVQYQEATRLSIPLVQPDWLLACYYSKKYVLPLSSHSQFPLPVCFIISS